MSEPRVPKGKPLNWSEEEMDALSEVTPEVIEAAKLAVRRDNPRLAALLDALPDDTP